MSLPEKDVLPPGVTPRPVQRAATRSPSTIGPTCSSTVMSVTCPGSGRRGTPAHRAHGRRGPASARRSPQPPASRPHRAGRPRARPATGGRGHGGRWTSCVRSPDRRAPCKPGGGDRSAAGTGAPRPRTGTAARSREPSPPPDRSRRARRPPPTRTRPHRWRRPACPPGRPTRPARPPGGAACPAAVRGSTSSRPVDSCTCRRVDGPATVGARTVQLLGSSPDVVVPAWRSAERVGPGHG